MKKSTSRRRGDLSDEETTARGDAGGFFGGG